MNNKIEKLNLHEHNKVAYEKVKKSFQVNNRCCVIHPTGTGKSFISLALIADHLDDNILYVTSYAKDLQQFESKMNEYLGDCENVDTCLYSGLQRILSLLDADKSVSKENQDRIMQILSQLLNDLEVKANHEREEKIDITISALEKIAAMDGLNDNMDIFSSKNTGKAGS